MCSYEAGLKGRLFLWDFYSMKKQILDIEDVAKLKKVHPGTVYHWIERGTLKPIKIVRSLFFNRKEIMKWQCSAF